MHVFASKPSSLIAVLFCGTALCQTTLHTKATLVVVPSVVTTVSKDVAFALSADDFLLTDKGIPQKINLEQDSDHPLVSSSHPDRGSRSRATRQLHTSRHDAGRGSR